MDAAIVPMEEPETQIVPNFMTEEQVREAELDRVRQQVAAGLLGGPEHRNLEPPDVLREVYEEEESSVQSKSIRSVDRKSNPLYARDMMLDVLNEMSYPRPETFEERRVLRKLRALKSFVRGSCGDVPGATAKDVRDILVLGKSQKPAIAALTELLSRRYEAATRFAAVELIQALAVPDVDSADGSRWDSIIGDGWAVSSNTERQKVLGFAPGLVEGLVRWLQSSCVRHESAANEREEAPHSLSPTKHRGQEWDRREVEVCSLVLMTLRNLCVSSETAQRLGECQAIPPLLTCLRFGPLELTQPAVACLVPIAIWHPRLVGLHGGVAPLVGMLRVPKLPLARAAAIRILGQVAIDEDDCSEIVDHGGCDLLAAIAFDGIGGRRRKPGLPSTVAHAQVGALWTLARIATHGEHVDCLRDDRIRKAILRSLEPDYNQVGTEAALMLLRKLGECSPFDEGDPWSSKLALDAAPLAAACAHHSRPEPVRAQAACCFEQLYISDHARHRLVFGRDVRDVEMTSETDFGPTDYLEVVYGKESAEASKARALKKAADLGQLSVLDSLKEEEDDAEAEKLAEEKRRLRTAPPPSTRVRVFDKDECEALRDAPVTKGKVSLLEAAGAPRLIKIDSGTVRWETRAKATGFVATCAQHNDYEKEYEEMRANPRLMEAMRAEARANKSLFSRYKDPCQRKPLRDGLPEGPVDVPEAYDAVECSDILECRRVTLPEIERHGVPETADCDPAGFFLIRTADSSILMECIPDRPAFGPMPSTKSDKEALARDVSRDWILRLLGLLEDHREALGKKFDLKAFDEDAWAMREERRKEHESGKKRRGSLSSIKDDPNEMNPRRWEALVERACGGHDDDMLHEMALAEQKGLEKPSPYRNAPTRRRKHPDVLKELWSMALHPTSVSLVQRGCLALLSLCSEPGVNAHVREHWKKELEQLPESLSTGVASRSKVLVTKKLELLVLLNQLELVEKNVWRVARPLRLKFQSIILNWRKHLGYSALSSATAGFDKETLLKLQELFAELDADGADSASKLNLNFLLKRRRRAREPSSPPRHLHEDVRRFSSSESGFATRLDAGSGYLDAEELGVLFKNMRMPMGQRELDDIVDEIDVDGNGT